MPKLLPHMQESFLEHAGRILHSEGYAALSIRRLASECSVATGTIYNYFRNKDELVARIMMVDWSKAIVQMDASAQSAETLEMGMSGLYRAIAAFVERYRAVWDQYAQVGGSGGVVASHHMQLRDQITERLQRLLLRTTNAELISIAPLLAETLLAAAVQTDIDETIVECLARRLASKGEDI